MVCYAGSYIHNVRNDVSTIKRQVADLDDTLKKNFNALIAKLDKRLDDIEIAVLDPHGETAEKLRKKHGIGVKKGRGLKPLSKSNEKAGAAT